MLGSRKIIVTCLLILTLLMSSHAAVAASVEQKSDRHDSSPEVMTVDILAARPLGFVAMVGGTLIFLVSWPFSALGGNSQEAWNTLVTGPAEYTFKRPLGIFNERIVTADN